MLRCIGKVRNSSTFSDLKRLIQDDLRFVGSRLQELPFRPLSGLIGDAKLRRKISSWEELLRLTAKAFGTGREFQDGAYDSETGVLHDQNTLVGVAQMMYVGYRIHKGIVNVQDQDQSADDHIGNKLSLLTGDYLLCKCFSQLNTLKCSEVYVLISTCLRDLVEADFIEPRTKENEPMPAKPQVGGIREMAIPDQFEGGILRLDEVLGRAKPEWTLRHLLGGVGLLAKSCQGSLILAGLPRHSQRSGYLFCRNVALARQASEDISTYEEREVPFCLINAPLMFHLEHDPSYYDELLQDDDLEYDGIRETVLRGPGLERTVDLRSRLERDAAEVLREFPDNGARRALHGMIGT